MAINFNITTDGIQNNPRLRTTPAFEQALVNADVAFNVAQVQAAVANLNKPTVLETAAGHATFASAAGTVISSASLSALDALRELYSPSVARDGVGR